MNELAVGIVLAAAVITALGVLWRKVLLPAASVVGEVQRLLPIVREIIDEWASTTSVPAILAEIAAQFRTDSGSTLRDVVNRLEQAADNNGAATRELTLRAEAQKEIAELDRAQVIRLAVLLDRLAVSVTSGNEGVERIEADRAADHARADETNGDPGAAADAAAKTGDATDVP